MATMVMWVMAVAVATIFSRDPPWRRRSPPTDTPRADTGIVLRNKAALSTALSDHHIVISRDSNSRTKACDT